MRIHHIKVCIYTLENVYELGNIMIEQHSDIYWGQE